MGFSGSISPCRSQCQSRRNPHRWTRITCRRQSPARMFIPHTVFLGVANCPGTRSSLLGCRPPISNGRSHFSRPLQPSIHPPRLVRKRPRSLHVRPFRNLQNRRYRDWAMGSHRRGMRKRRVSPIGNPLTTFLAGRTVSKFGRASSGRTARGMLRMPSRRRRIQTVRCGLRMICDLLLRMTDQPRGPLWGA